MYDYEKILNEGSKVGLLLNDFLGLTKESQKIVLDAINDNSIIALLCIDKVFHKSIKMVSSKEKWKNIIKLIPEKTLINENEVKKGKAKFLNTMLELKKENKIKMERDIIL